MSENQNTIIVPYKIDTDSDENIMPVDMFKSFFLKVTDEQLATSRNKHILLKKYNKTTLTQLSMCTILVENKNDKKNVNFL